jgi:hypothetical protein
MHCTGNSKNQQAVFGRTKKATMQKQAKKK